MGINRVAMHIKRTIAHVLAEHQHKNVDMASGNIRNDLSNYMYTLFDTKVIHDFSVSVVRVDINRILVSIAVKNTESDPFILFPAELHVHDVELDHVNAFDRAMQGV